MTNTDSEINAAILSLLRAGIQITIVPLEGPFGFIHAGVLFTPPQPQTTSPTETWKLFAGGEPLALPLRTEISLYYQLDQLRDILTHAKLLYVRPPTNAP